ncbi:MAG: hypothetical protein AB7Y46_20405 [Armatimonadota bacterium]
MDDRAYDTSTHPQQLRYNNVWSTAEGVNWERHPEAAAWRPRLPLPAPHFGTVAAASAVAVGWAAILVAAGTATPAPALIAADGAIARAYFAITHALHPTALALGVEGLWVIGTGALLVQELREWRPALRGQLVRLTTGAGLIYVLSMAFVTPIPGLFASLPGLDRAIDAALEAFAEDHGCYPARLENLTAAEAPATGVDASGNPVPIAGAYAGPYLRLLPMDPLTGRRDTWVYEVTGSPMVDSGGYHLTIATREEPQRTTARERRWLLEREASAP